jgi:hypothetical protein
MHGYGRSNSRSWSSTGSRRLQEYLRWRNTNAHHPDILAAQRPERTRIRSERQQRWCRPKTRAA